MNRKLYRRFADVYDAMGANRFSVEMAEYTVSLTHRFDIEVEDALDLCCGTGSALAFFSRRKWRLAGVDQSPDMLRSARKKLAGTGTRLYRRHLPMFSIPLPNDTRRGRGFDLVTSFYDSLNYLLTTSDLKAAFVSVHAHLRPDGWFIFDMNTPKALTVLWDGHVYADARDDLAWVWKNSYDERTRSADCEATFFVRKGRLWDRFTEVHTERAYPNSIIRKLLREAGFAVRAIYRCRTFEKPTRDCYRICVVARKKR